MIMVHFVSAQVIAVFAGLTSGGSSPTNTPSCSFNRDSASAWLATTPRVCGSANIIGAHKLLPHNLPASFSQILRASSKYCFACATSIPFDWAPAICGAIAAKHARSIPRHHIRLNILRLSWRVAHPRDLPGWSTLVHFTKGGAALLLNFVRLDFWFEARCSIQLSYGRAKPLYLST